MQSTKMLHGGSGDSSPAAEMFDKMKVKSSEMMFAALFCFLAFREE
jgi:hypothetical protein